jgi:hypothetical protein
MEINKKQLIYLLGASIILAAVYFIAQDWQIRNLRRRVNAVECLQFQAITERLPKPEIKRKKKKEPKNEQ